MFAGLGNVALAVTAVDGGAVIFAVFSTSVPLTVFGLAARAAAAMAGGFTQAGTLAGSFVQALAASLAFAGAFMTVPSTGGCSFCCFFAPTVTARFALFLALMTPPLSSGIGPSGGYRGTEQRQQAAERHRSKAGARRTLSSAARSHCCSAQPACANCEPT